MNYHTNKGMSNIVMAVFFIFFQISFYYLLNIEKASQSKKVFFMEISIFVIITLFERIYEYKSYLFWEELRKMVKIHSQFFFMMSIIHICLYRFSMMILIMDLIKISVFLLLNILLVKIIRKYMYKYLKKNLLIIGTGELSKKLNKIIEENMFTMYDLKGYVRYAKNSKILIDKESLVCDFEEMEINITENIDEIIIAVDDITEKEVAEIVSKFDNRVNKIKYIPNINGLFTFNSEIEDYDGLMLITAGQYITSFKRKVIKRMFDISLGSIGIVFYLLLYLTIGKKIKQADGGSPLFKHDRIGKGLQKFPMYKFRSMYIDAEDRLEKMLASDEKIRDEFYTNFKLKDDPRITKVGAFIRKTSLDEFPQFINVIKGDMSIVGPRPVVQKEVDMYYGTEVGKQVFTVKPGITGMWQAHGRSDIEDYDERIALDLYYIRNWSLWLDIIILIKTVKNVLRRKGAY